MPSDYQPIKCTISELKDCWEQLPARSVVMITHPNGSTLCGTILSISATGMCLMTSNETQEEYDFSKDWSAQFAVQSISPQRVAIVMQATFDLLSTLTD